jgi:CubicO group peptidase (beta-lactamase class C family)
MPVMDLPRSAPSTQGVDATGLAAFIDALESSPGIEPHSVMLLRHGHVVAEAWWAPYTPGQPHLVYSLSKIFTATALGIAVGEGLVSPDDTVLDFFPELDEEITDPRKRALLVRHIATMASGDVTDTLLAAYTKGGGDILRGFLLTPPQQPPGTVFTYNQPCTNALVRIIRRVSGQSLVDYLRPRLLDPLGITDVGWQADPQGRELGFTGLHVTTDAIARLGLLHLQHGRWNGVQLLPEGWTDLATRRHIDTAGPGTSAWGQDWKQGYGFQFWRSTHGYRGDGAYGQFCLVLPDQDAVLALTNATQDMQGVLDAVWEHVIPAMDAAPPPDRTTTADATLASRLGQTALAPVAGAPQPDDEARWDGARLSVTGTPTLTAMSIARHGTAWHVVLEGPRTVTPHGDIPRPPDRVQLTARLGTGEWAVGEPAGPDGHVIPVAVSGGWTAPGTLRLDVIFLQTPHRVEITCSADEESATAVFPTPPLWPAPLVEFRSPRSERV